MRFSTFLKKWNPPQYRNYVREKEFAKKNFSPLDPWTVQAELCWVGHRTQPPSVGRWFLANKVDRQQSRPSWLPLAIASGSLVRVSSQVLLWTHPNSWKRTTSSQRCCSLGTWCWVALPSLASAAATSAVELLSFFLGLAQGQHGVICLGMLCLLLLSMSLRLWCEREIDQVWLPALMGGVTLTASLTPICILQNSPEGSEWIVYLQGKMPSSSQRRR